MPVPDRPAMLGGAGCSLRGGDEKFQHRKLSYLFTDNPTNAFASKSMN
jgi:hypothetical protein